MALLSHVLYVLTYILTDSIIIIGTYIDIPTGMIVGVVE